MSADKLSYVDYDFNDLVRQLQDRLRARETWKDTYISATGQTLIELYAYVANLMLYYIERRAEECYLSTARNKSSIINLVQLLGYSPKRNISSTGTAQFSVTTPPEGTIFIDAGTRVSTASGVQFVTTEQGTIAKGSTVSNAIRIVQGVRQTITVSSTGAANQQVLIDSTTVENNTYSDFKTLRVFVGTREWTQVSSFLRSGTADRHFVVRSNLDDTVTVVFGDNLRGAVPANGRLIRIEYLDSSGNAGNVYEVNKVDTVLSPSVSFSYTDENNVPQTGTRTLSVENTSAITGGSDRETAEEIRNEAPAVFQTGDRLVIRSDFEAFLVNTENIIEVRVWGENEELRGENSNFEMFNVVKIVLLLQEWQRPLQDTKNRLEDKLYEKSLMTVKYEFVDAVIFEVVPVLEVVVNRKYALSTTQAEIESALREQFKLGSTAKFGQAKRVSNLVEKVDSIDAVKYLHMVLEIREELTDTETSGEWEGLLQSDTVKPGTVKLYDGTTLLAVDSYDGSNDMIGTFVAVDEETIINGTINYAAKEVQVEVVPSPEGTLSIRYQQDEGGDVIVGNEGICKLHSVDITSIKYGN